MLAELLGRQARGLLLQLQLGDAIAQRLLGTLGGQARLVERAQLGGQVVELESRGAQRLLLGRADFQRVLQAGVGGLLVDGLEFGAGILQRGGDALDLVVRDLDAALELVDAVGRIARREARVVGRAFEIAGLLAGIAQFLVERLEGELVVLELRLQLGQLAVVAFEEVRLGFGPQRARCSSICAPISSSSSRICVLRCV